MTSSIVHINIDGLLNKIPEIKVIIEESDLDILSITETHLSATISDDQLNIDGYEFARRDRKEDDFTKTHEGIWGGYLTYFKNYLQIAEMNDKLESNIEAVWVKLILYSQRVLIGTIYRHPKDIAFYDKFNTVLEGIWRKIKNIILLGDFNSDMKARSQEERVPNNEKKLMRILNNFDLRNNKKRSHTQLDSRKQVIAFQDRVITINIKEAQHPLKREKQVIDKSS